MHEKRAIRLLQRVQILKKLLSEKRMGGDSNGQGSVSRKGALLGFFPSVLALALPVNDVIGLLGANDA